MSLSGLECGICFNAFNDEHCPRNLPCSHTFCSVCINAIISTQSKTCPVCKGEFSVRLAEDLMINRALLDVAQQLASQHLEEKPSSERLKTFLQFKRDFREKFTKKSIADCERKESQIRDDIRSYRKIKEIILAVDEVIDRIAAKQKEMKLSNEIMVNVIDADIEFLENQLYNFKQDKEEFQESDKKLESAESFCSVGPIVEKTETTYDHFREKVKIFQDNLNKIKGETKDFQKKLLRRKTMLENIAMVMGHIDDDDDSPVNITANDLQGLGGFLKDLNGLEMFAVMTFDGQHKMAPLNIEADDQIFLSHFREGDAPSGSFVIKGKLLIDSLMEKCSRRAFLDLGSDGTFFGRIIIKLIDEGNLALNFFHMCAGDMGPTFVDFCSVCTTSDGDGIWSGTGSDKMILPGVDGKIEFENNTCKKTTKMVGQVRAVINPIPRSYSSEFYFVTRDDPKFTGKAYIGMVEQGFDVLTKAMTLYPNFEGVRVVNCGLVISL